MTGTFQEVGADRLARQIATITLDGAVECNPVEGPAAPYPARIAWVALAILVLLVTFSAVDRVALPLQAERIRIAFALSDFQLGLLQDTGGAIFAALCAYPIAWLADRYDRRWVLALCLVTWSGAAVMCGLAPSFTAILIASSFLAAGGAGVLPIAQAYVGNLFAGQARQTANSFFYFSTAAGGALAMIGVGQLIGFVDAAHSAPGSMWADWDPWRLVFFCVALPAPFFMLLLPLLPRVANSISPAAKPALSAMETEDAVEAGPTSFFGYLRSHSKVMLGVYGGVGLLAFGQSSVSVWSAVVAMREFHQTPAQVGFISGMILLVLLPVALGINLLVSRWAVPRFGVSTPIRIMRYAFILGFFVHIGLMFTRTAAQFYGVFFVLNLILLPAMMNLPGLLQSLGPSAMLSRIFAVNVMISTACAAVSAPFVGIISDMIAGAPFGLLMASAGTGAVAIGLAALAFALVERRYGAHAAWVETERAELAMEGQTG